MLLNIDLSGADWITVAMLSRDPAMLDVVHSGRSPHPVTGARMCGVTEDEVKADDKLIGLIRDTDEIAERRKAKLPEMVAKATFLPRTMSIRQAAKKANHGANYREGYKVFALQNEMDEKESKKILAQYTCQCSDSDRDKSNHAETCKPAYPGIRLWWNEIDETLRKGRTLTNCFARKLYFMGAVGNDMFKQGYAFIPASTTVDCCNVGMVGWMEDDSEDFRAARLLVQGHDSLLFSYPPTDFNAMARFCVKLGREYMRPVLDYGEPYQLNTDLKVGLSWGQLTEVKLSDDPDSLADKLREAWDVSHERKKAA